MKLVDLTGQKFGRWLVIDLDEKRGTSYYWNCLCSCGEIRSIRGTSLQGGGSKSCGCEWRERLSIQSKRLFTKNGAAAREVYGRYKVHAAERDRAFDLSLEEFVQITSQPCYYCDALPARVNTACSGETFTYNGIDRKDNFFGYVKTNCVPCCTHCNWMKGRLSAEVFINSCIAVAQHQNQKLLQSSLPKLTRG